MPKDPANRFSTIVELWPSQVEAFIAHCGQKSDRSRTMALNMCYCGFDQWHVGMGKRFVEKAAEFFNTTTANILTDKARPLFEAKIKAGNSRKGSRGSRWCRLESMPDDPNERLSCLVVKHGAVFVARFITEAKVLPCSSPSVQKALPRYVDNLLYGRFDLFHKAFPPVLREFVCAYFGYDRFEDCFTPMRKDHLERSVDLFAFKAPVLVKLRRISDTLKQLTAMGVSISPDTRGLFFEMHGATHASDFAIVTTHGELTRRKLITDVAGNGRAFMKDAAIIAASEGNGFDMQDLEGSREKSLVKLE